MTRRRLMTMADGRRTTGGQPGRVVLLVFALLAMGLVACDDAFDPISGEPASSFAVFGVLDTALDVQTVRVSPLRRQLAIDPEELQAEVVSVQLEAGRETVWQGEVLEAADGSLVLLFRAPLTLGPGETVRLDVRRVGAAEPATRAFTQTPARATLDLDAPRENFNRQIVQDVTLRGLPRPPTRLDLVYRFHEPGAPEDTLVVVLNFLDLQDRGRDTGTTLNLQADRLTVLRRLGRDPGDPQLVLLDLGLRIELISEELDRPLSPEPPPNIENGFGRFGAVTHYAEFWRLDEETTRRLGYRPPEP